MALRMLISISGNIIDHPREMKFQRIKMSKGSLRRKLTNVPGGMACLSSLGFTTTTYEGEAVWAAPSTGFDRQTLIDRRSQFAVELKRLSDDQNSLKRINGPADIIHMLE